MTLITEDRLKEIWKPVRGYEGLYEVSNLGSIKSLPKYHGPFFRKSFKIKTSIKRGYETATISKNNTPKTLLVHRIVAKAFIPNPENKPQVNHIDSCRTNNHINNLEWCSCVENMRHAWKYGYKKSKMGSENHFSKPVLDLYTGVFFDCAKDASKALNISYSKVKEHLQIKDGISRKGHKTNIKSRLVYV